MTPHALPSRPTLLNWITILVLGLIWGASFLAVRVALDGYSPLWLAAGRILIGAVTLALLCLILRLPLPRWRANRRVWLHAAGMALLTNALPFALIAWSQQHVTSSFVGISMALVPLFTLALGHFLLRGEGMTPFRLVGVVLGFAGVFVLIGPGTLRPAEGGLEMLAQLACLIVTFSYSLGGIVTRRSPPVDPIAFSTAALLLASGMIVPLALWVDGWPEVTPGLPLLALAYLGLMPTALATLLMVWIIRSAGPTFLTLTNYQVPVWSVIFGVTLLNETLPASFLLALALILAGIAISRARWRRAVTATP